MKYLLKMESVGHEKGGSECQYKSAVFTGAVFDDDTSGTYKGYIGTSGELDDVGDIILTGGFKRTAKDNLDKIFFAIDHSWSIRNEVGVVTHAEEDAKGLYVEGVFHDTQDAQDARKKMLKRLKYGKPVKTSIGYSPSAQPFYIYPNQYERELPKYLKKEHLQAGLAKAARFSKIRILPEVEVFEGSGVQIPANPSAELTSVKSLEGTEVNTSVRTDMNTAQEQKGYFESAIAERVAQDSLWTYFGALEKAIHELREDCDEGECPDADMALKGILNAFAKALYVNIYPTLAALSSDTEMDEMKCAVLDEHISILLNLKQGTIGNLQNATHYATVQAAVAEYVKYSDVVLQEVRTHANRQLELIQKRQNEKAGRTISNATHGRLMGHCSSIDEMVKNLLALKEEIANVASTGREEMNESEKTAAAETPVEEKGQPGENQPDAPNAEEAATPEIKSESETVTATVEDKASTEESAIDNAPEAEAKEAHSATVDEQELLRKQREAKAKELELEVAMLSL